MSNIQQLTKEEFQKEVLDCKDPVLVDFFATWCAPCRALTPILVNASNELAGKIKVVKIDVDTAQDIAKKYGVMSVPTMVLISNGIEKERLVGLVNKQSIIDKVKKHINN